MKLWDKGYSIDKKIDVFTVGNDRALDEVLARYDVIGNRAQAVMLNKIGVLTDDELKDILRELDVIAADIEKGGFTIGDEFEDVHSKIEFMLTERLGDTGKKIHTARSRNDQVLTDMHLYVRDELLHIRDGVKRLFDLLLGLSEKYKDVLLPGYTHLQVAMPSSFGLWFGAYAESLVDDVYMIGAAYRVADQNPLGGRLRFVVPDRQGRNDAADGIFTDESQQRGCTDGTRQTGKNGRFRNGFGSGDTVQDGHGRMSVHEPEFRFRVVP